MAERLITLPPNVFDLKRGRPVLLSTTHRKLHLTIMHIKLLLSERERQLSNQSNIRVEWKYDKKRGKKQSVFHREIRNPAYGILSF